MRFKLTLTLAALVLVSPVQTIGTERDKIAAGYTIQVASFPNPAEARKLLVKLERLGERVTASVVELRGRGRWTRILVGTFATAGKARIHANLLLGQGVIREFLIIAAPEREQSTRSSLSKLPQPQGLPGSQLTFDSELPPSSQSQVTPPVLPSPARSSRTWPEESRAGIVVTHRPGGPRAAAVASLPLAKPQSLSVTPSMDIRLLLRPDPVSLAFLLITGSSGHQRGPRQGGLWITGDTADGLARLRWIAGDDAADLVSVEPDGRVKLDTRGVAKAAGVDTVPSVEGPLAVTAYVCANEGLLLLVQLTQARHRYRLHFASEAPTLGSAVQVTSGINLDNNFDSRINPNRRLGKKMDTERPPDGFDSLIAINPVARWFNQQTNQLVPGAHIAFHELAEAHAKLEMDLDYLGNLTRPGAHGVALEREKRLKFQRPHAGVVLTDGPNRVLRSEEEMREFFSQLRQLAP